MDWCLAHFWQGPANILGRIILSPTLRNRPLHQRANALPHPAGRFRLRGPDRRQRGQNISRRDVLNLQLAELGKGIGFKRGYELRRMFCIPSRRHVQCINLAGSFLKGWGSSGCASGLPRVTIDRANLWFSIAAARASAKDTSSGEPNPSSQRLPRMLMRCTQ